MTHADKRGRRVETKVATSAKNFKTKSIFMCPERVWKFRQGSPRSERIFNAIKGCARPWRKARVCLVRSVSMAEKGWVKETRGSFARLYCSAASLCRMQMRRKGFCIFINFELRGTKQHFLPRDKTSACIHLGKSVRLFSIHAVGGERIKLEFK